MTCKILTRSTKSVSLTGHECEMCCMHCGGKFLKGMIPIHSIDIGSLKKQGIKSLLISGGMDAATYSVPVYDHLEALKELKENGFLLNFHTGLIDTSLKGATEFFQLADRISFDLNFSPNVLRKIYRMPDVTADRVKRVFESLYQEAGGKVVPHLCAGLDFGRIGPEYEVLDYLKGFPELEKIVFIVFFRKKGTDMEHSPLPEISELNELFRYATDRFMPGVKVVLGCMRSFSGPYAADIEKAAVDAGFYAVVNPRSCLDVDMEISDVCCAF